MWAGSLSLVSKTTMRGPKGYGKCDKGIREFVPEGRNLKIGLTRRWDCLSAMSLLGWVRQSRKLSKDLSR